MKEFFKTKFVPWIKNVWAKFVPWIKNLWANIVKGIKNNYWLQPVLLVALVFVIIFGIQLVPQWISNASSNKAMKSGGCVNCTTSTMEEVNTKLKEDDNDFYVIITQTTCANCEKAYPIVNKFLASNTDIVLYKINIEKGSDEVYIDETITSDEILYDFGKLVDVGVTSSLYDSIYDEENDEYVFLTPTIVHFEDGVATEALTGVDSYNDLAEFFEVE